MKKIRFIYTEKDHRWAVIARDPERAPYMIDTNECLVIEGDQALLTDPGGMEIFPSVFSAIGSGFNPKNIKNIFSSHQDPDVISSLPLWLEVNPEIKCHISRLWSTFIPHFGGDDKTLIAIPDEGATIMVGKIKLKVVPAHYLHSPGNFHLYDSRAKIYFSGDVGAAILPDGSDLYVKNFDEHIKHAEGFHKRWMGSNEAKLDWCKRASELEIDLLIPQHGAIYQGPDVGRFINWFSELPVGLFVFVPANTKNISEEKSQIENMNFTDDLINDDLMTNAGLNAANAVSRDVKDLNDSDHSDLEALIENGAGQKNDLDQNRKSGRDKKSFFAVLKGLFTGKK